MRPPALLFCPLLLIGSLLPGLTHAAPVVLHGSDDDAVTAATTAKAALGTGDLSVAGSIAEAVGPVDGLVVVGGELAACPDPPSKPPVVAGVLVQSTASIDQMEYAEAITSLETVTDRLPCSGAGATRDEIFQLWFLRGIAAFNGGDERSARAAFNKAASVDPSRKWDEAFPPTPKALYLEALQDALARDPVPFDVRIDGLALNGEPLPSGIATVLVGEHVLTLDGQAWQLTVTPGGGPGVLAAPEAVVRGVLQGDALGVAWLTDASAQRSWSEVVIVDGDRVRRFRRGAWVVDAPTATASGPAPLFVAGLGTAGAGLGLLAGGVTAAAVARARAFDGEVALVDDEDTYRGLQRQSQAGAALAVVGGVATAAGAALTVLGLVLPREGGVAWTPVLGAGPGGVTLGITGRF